MDIFKLVATLGLDSSGFYTGLVMAADMFTSFTNKVIGFSKDVMNTGLGFDQAMANVTAVLGKEEGTVENMNRLRVFALDQARESIFTARDTADAYYYMGMAGWKSEEMLAGLPGVMALAAASGENLGAVSDIVTDSLTAFDLTAKDTQRYVDILAQTATNANTNVGLMGETFKYVAPIAGSLGAGVDDVAVSIGLMANAGIKGSMAGTALRNIFTRISTDAGASKEKLGAMGIITQELGVSFWDAEGKMRDWGDVITDIRGKWQGLTQEQEVAYAKQIASERGMSGWLAIMNASEENVKKLTAAIGEASGAAQTMSEVRLDSLAGDITRMNSTMDILKITIYDNVKDPLRDAVQVFTDGMQDVTDVINEEGLAAGIDAFSKKLEELIKDEAVQNLLRSAGNLLGVVLDGVFDHILPVVTERAGDVVAAFMGGLSESTAESSNVVLNIVSFLSGGLSGALNRTKTLNIEDVTIDLNIEDIQAAIDKAQENGEATVTINGVTFPSSFNAVDVMDVFISATDKCITDGFAQAVVNGEDIFAVGANDAASQYENEFGAAGKRIGEALVSDIDAALSGASFGIKVTPNTAVQKNASAMAAGRIFTRPTIFGYANGALQEAGDAGAEAVVGVNSLSQMINDAVGNAMSGFAAMIPADNGRDIKIVLQLDNREFGEAVYHANNEIMQRVGVKLADIRR